MNELSPISKIQPDPFPLFVARHARAPEDNLLWSLAMTNRSQQNAGSGGFFYSFVRRLMMNARKSSLRWAILGMATTCVILSLASFALEYFFPINSGVGPDIQLFALIHTLPIAIAIFVCSSVIAAVLRWNILAARRHEFLFGAFCGLSQAYSVLIRLGVPLTQLNINDLTFYFVVLVIAIFGRSCLATKSAANA